MGRSANRWTVVGESVTRGRRRYEPRRCLCGAEKLVRVDNKSLSCGCLVRDLSRKRMTKHGQAARPTRTRAYTSWVMARNRCNNPRNEHYPDYGGRGIRFVFESFAAFFAELGERPEGTTTHRINNDGNYEPGNVKWADATEQANNRRDIWRKRKRK